MKSKDLRALSVTELDEKIDGFKQELFNLRWQSASHQNQNPKRARTVRRLVARILTIKNERSQEGAAQ
jgi:large subunit ribosomal protein L29